jgi:hypothetical protein
MFDQILTVAVVLLPTIFAVVIELVSEDIKKSGFWRVGVLVFGVVLSILTFYQIHRADGIAAKDREDAIEKTSQSVSEKVVPKVAAETSANVTEALNQQYGSVISGLYRELAEQSATGKNQLALNYKPSVDIIYAGDRLQIWNRGRTNIYFEGDKYDNLPRSMGDQRIVIPPTDNYYLLANYLNPYILKTLGQNGEARVPFEIYLRTEDGKKYIMHNTLWEVVKDGQITIHTQTHGFEEKDWSSK